MPCGTSVLSILCGEFTITIHSREWRAQVIRRERERELL